MRLDPQTPVMMEESRQEIMLIVFNIETGYELLDPRAGKITATKHSSKDFVTDDVDLGLMQECTLDDLLGRLSFTGEDALRDIYGSMPYHCIRGAE